MFMTGLGRENKKLRFFGVGVVMVVSRKSARAGSDFGEEKKTRGLAENFF